VVRYVTVFARWPLNSLQLQLWLVSSSPEKVERLSFGHHPQSHKINSALWIVPVRYLAFLGQAEGPEASTETRPSDL
jgi:hypothetical protein